jgi:hypothetical protein
MNTILDAAQQLLIKADAMRQDSLKHARETGASFNIFSILGLEHYETRTHSSFLAELLNPKGSHGQEDRFLVLFIKQLNLEEFNSFNTATAEVLKEVSIGRIDAEYKGGGAMDILIRDSNGYALGIENKIYAGDQENQLGRYVAYLNDKHSKKNQLLYLTLDGKEASEFSSTYGKVEYRTVSYEKDILNWLRGCMEIVSGIPILKEAIGQYIELIKKLTHQSMDVNTQKELVNWILENGYVQTVQETNNLWDQVRTELLRRLKDSIVNRFEEQYKGTGYSLHVEIPDKFGFTDSGFRITHETWKVPVYIGFEKKDASQVYIGIKAKGIFVDDTTAQSAKALFEKLELGATHSSHSWLVYTFLDPWERIVWEKAQTNGVDLLMETITNLLGNYEFIEFMKKPD